MDDVKALFHKRLQEIIPANWEHYYTMFKKRRKCGNSRAYLIDSIHETDIEPVVIFPYDDAFDSDNSDQEEECNEQ